MREDILFITKDNYNILKREIRNSRPQLIIMDELIEDTNKKVAKSSFLAEKGGHYGSKKFKKK